MAKSERCQSCREEFGVFTWRYTCGRCDDEFCDDCLSEDFPVQLLKHIQKTDGDRFCKSCLKWYKDFKRDSLKIESFSHRYEGRIPLDSSKQVIDIKTGYHRDRDDAELEAKLIAHYNDCDLIFESKFIKSTDSEPGPEGGEHIYSVWKARCKCGIRQKRAQMGD